MTTDVLLVDDSRAFLAAVTQFLVQLPDVKVVGQAHNGHEALSMALALRPDLVLLDIVMPEMDGLQVARAMQAWPQPPRIVFLSMQDSASFQSVLGALGVAGFVDKANFVVELLPLIRPPGSGLSVADTAPCPCPREASAAETGGT